MGRQIADEAHSAPQPSRGEPYAFSLAYIAALLAFTGSASGVAILALSYQFAVALPLLDGLGLISAVLCWGSAGLLLLFKDNRIVRIAAGALLATIAAVLVTTGTIAEWTWFLVVPVVGIYGLALYLLLSGRLASPGSLSTSDERG